MPRFKTTFTSEFSKNNFFFRNFEHFCSGGETLNLGGNDLKIFPNSRNFRKSQNRVILKIDDREKSNFSNCKSRKKIEMNVL